MKFVWILFTRKFRLKQQMEAQDRFSKVDERWRSFYQLLIGKKLQYLGIEVQNQITIGPMRLANPIPFPKKQKIKFNIRPNAAQEDLEGLLVLMLRKFQPFQIEVYRKAKSSTIFLGLVILAYTRFSGKKANEFASTEYPNIPFGGDAGILFHEYLA